MSIDSFQLADRYRDATIDEVAALKKLASYLPPDPIIVNIGAGNRAISTLAMLEERPDALIFSIDTHEKANEAVYLQKAGLNASRVIRVLGRSQDAGLHWPFDVDMVYVDGDHSYDGVKGDGVWLSKVRPGGIVAFHDYVDREGRYPTPVSRAVDELMDGYVGILQVDRIVAYWQKE